MAALCCGTMQGDSRMSHQQIAHPQLPTTAAPCPRPHLPDGGMHAVLHAQHFDGCALLLQPLKQRALHLDLRAAVEGRQCSGHSDSRPGAVVGKLRSGHLDSRPGGGARLLKSSSTSHGEAEQTAPTSHLPPANPLPPAWPAQTEWWRAAAAGLPPAPRCNDQDVVVRRQPRQA